MTRRLQGLVVFVAAALAASPRLAVARSEAAPAIALTATLVDPTDIVLHWTDSDPQAVAHAVEYATAPDDDYVTMEFLPAGVTEFRHTRLMPDTTFYYRVRPIYGPASNTAEAIVPPRLSDAEYRAGFAAPEDYTWAPPRSLPARLPAQRASLRQTPNLAACAPTDLSAEYVPSTVSGFRLTWTCRARDEDGYLLEQRQESGAFAVCAVTPPGTNSFGWALMPPVRHEFFRVRPFYFGNASNIARQTTGPSAVAAN